MPTYSKMGWLDRVVGVNWGQPVCVLSFRALWRGTLDFPNNPLVACGSKLFTLYGNPVDVHSSKAVFVSGKPIYRSVVTSGGGVLTTTTEHWLFDAVATLGLDTSTFFGVAVSHVFDTDGNDFWAGVAGIAPTFDEYVALIAVTFDSYSVSNVRLDSSSTSSTPKPTIWEVEQNALVFIHLPAFKGEASPLVIQFDTGLRPFPDETIVTYYKWQATAATFSSTTIDKFTSTKNIPGAWLADAVASQVLGNIAVNQLHEYLLEFDVNQKTLAVAAHQTLVA